MQDLLVPSKDSNLPYRLDKVFKTSKVFLRKDIQRIV